MPYTLEQIGTPNFYPNLAISGSEQAINITNARIGDKVAWTLQTQAGATTCNGSGTVPTTIKTSEYTLSDTSQTFSLHSFADPGLWYLCYQPAGGTWTVVQKTILMRGVPTFGPIRAVAGSVTDITLSSAAIDGDYVVVQPANCIGAHLRQTGVNTLARQVVKDFKFTMSPLMTDTNTTLYVCYATAESGGNTEGAYAPLPGYNLTLVPKPSFATNRTVTGAPQEMTVFGVQPGDKALWTSGSCNTTTGPATATKTVIYDLNITAGTNDEASVALHSTASSGHWQLCYLLQEGAWATVTGKFLTVIPHPTFSPLTGIAGSLTPLSFAGHANGDSVVLAAGASCSAVSAHVNLESASSRGKQVIGNSTVATTTAMTNVTSLILCYATRESGANTIDDFSRLPVEFNQLQVPTFTPHRTVVGASQVITVTHVANNDQIKWVLTDLRSALEACQTEMEAPTLSSTANYTLTTAAPTAMLHTMIHPGSWHVCYQPRGGLWTVLTGQTLLIIPRPTPATMVGVAGAVTRITFNGTVDGDKVSLDASGCGSAHSVGTLGSSLTATSLVNATVATTQQMTTATTLRICFATA